MLRRTVVIGCDNAAVELKGIVKNLLESQGIDVEDVGVDNGDNKELYPNIASSLSKKIQESNFEKRGILLCGTGIGMAITANKFEGIYAAVCHDNFAAERSILSNNANVLCLGSRIVGPELAKKIVKEWINLEFVPSASSEKIDRLKEIEKENFKEKISAEN